MKHIDLIPRAVHLERPDATALLDEDHDKLTALFQRFDDIRHSRALRQKEAIVALACRVLAVHTALEEEIFYPAVREAVGDDDMMDDAAADHEGAMALVRKLESMDASDAGFNSKFLALARHTMHHIAHEQDVVFPRARAAGLDLARLGERILERRQELLAGTPAAHLAARQVATDARKMRARRSDAQSPR